jgi:cellobiose epimerase
MAKRHPEFLQNIIILMGKIPTMYKEIQKLRSEMESELRQNILPFWMNKAIDKGKGGFLGQINGHGEVVKDADKGGILNARILWTFSAAYNQIKNSEYRQTAEYCKNYSFVHFFDSEFGGTYWKLTHEGKPADTKKQIYSQAFFIYALAENYKATGDKACLDKAIELYRLIEEKSFDSRLNGYFEAYSREWKLLEDLRLSDKDANEKKTTNTHLHILEAYTNLYRIWKDEELEKQLRNLVLIFTDKILDPVWHHLLLFFDEKWDSKSTLVSYGHDIEASWLVYEAAKVLGDAGLTGKVKPLCIALAKASLEGFQEDGSMIYEKDEDKGIKDMDKHWWPQAETIIGLINLFEMTGDEQYLSKAIKCWNFVSDNLIDRKNGEWFWSIKDGKPNLKEDKAGFWKCPYHNARACLEVMARCDKLKL